LRWSCSCWPFTFARSFAACCSACVVAAGADHIYVCEPDRLSLFDALPGCRCVVGGECVGVRAATVGAEWLSLAGADRELLPTIRVATLARACLRSSVSFGARSVIAVVVRCAVGTERSAFCAGDEFATVTAWPREPTHLVRVAALAAAAHGLPCFGLVCGCSHHTTDRVGQPAHLVTVTACRCVDRVPAGRGYCPVVPGGMDEGGLCVPGGCVGPG